jgi:hypothetical protein
MATRHFVAGVIALLGVIPTLDGQSSSVTFHNIAAGDQSGIRYRRRRSATQAIFDGLKVKDPYRLAPSKRRVQGALHLRCGGSRTFDEPYAAQRRGPGRGRPER